MTFTLLLDEIKINISEILTQLQVPTIDFSVEPAKPGFGDATCNVAFLLSRHLKKSPQEIAKIISTKYPTDAGKYVCVVSAHPSGYVNFEADMSALAKVILRDSCDPEYGFVDTGKSSRIVVEHTSVNPNKALHIGHIRNIVIGDTLSRILRKANYDVRVLNYVDDSGLQVADIVLGFTKLGFAKDAPPGIKFDHYCGDEVYVKTTARYTQQPELEQTRKAILKQIEEGTSETAIFADSVTKRVLESQLQTCKDLFVTYDCLNFESQIIRSGLWSMIFEKLKNMKLVEFENDGKNAGCWVIRGSTPNDDKVIVRNNGTATYIAKDIPYAAWKLGLVDDPFYYEKYNHLQQDSKTLWSTTLEDTGIKKDFTGDRVITVIDSRQSRLQQIIIVLMDKFKAKDSYIHLGYESVTLSADTVSALGIKTDDKAIQMSGRKGLYISADSVYAQLLEKSMSETRKRNADLDDTEAGYIAQTLSVGAMRYEMIKQDLEKSITFDLKKSLSLEGDTSLYIQYTHARASRILEKSGITANFDSGHELLTSTYEKNLIRLIGLFANAVNDSARNLSPKVIARYCHDLAVTFNAFYENIKVLDSSDAALINARICLVLSFQKTIANALSLLGIDAPTRI